MVTFSTPVGGPAIDSRGAPISDEPGQAAIDKALHLYGILSSRRAPMRLSDLSRDAGLPKSTTHRLLNTLTRSGIVVRAGVAYSATERSGHSAPAAKRWWDLLRRFAPFVGDVYVRTGLTTSLAVLEDTDVVFAHRVYGHDNAWTPSDDSGRESAHDTAAGRLLLAADPQATLVAGQTWGLAATEAAHLYAELTKIRHRWFSVAEKAGITCLAVPLRAAPGRPNIALTVKGKTRLIDHDRTLFRLHEVARAAVKAAV
jgi:DNA-binding IclR family transcriptional regulator